MFTFKQCSETGLFRPLPNYVFQKRNEANEVMTSMKQKIQKYFFVSQAIASELTCGKFSLLRREYLSSAVNVIINSPKTSDITMGDIFQLYFPESDEKMMKVLPYRF